MALMLSQRNNHPVEEPDDEESNEVERMVAGFTVEPSIQHNQYPDSDRDDEGGEESQRGAPDSIRRSPTTKLYVGQCFFDKFSITETVLDYALKTGRNIDQFRYDKNKLGFRCCGGNCKWRLYCAISSHSDKWVVRSYEDEHSCLPNGECEILKVPVIARLFVDKIRDEPDYYLPAKIQAIILENWKINVSRPQCQAARNKAVRWIESWYDKEFERLRDYGAEILESNPNSTVEIETHTNAEGLDVFDRFYVCFDVLRRTWSDTCRPLIGMDGCFLKTKMKGQLLVALGRDADNGIYPIAWAVVQVENTANWMWFVRMVKSDLHLEDGEGYVLISDRQKGLIRSVEVELPKIEHRMCVRHIYANLKTRHGKKPEMKPLIWNLAWSYNEADYRENLSRVLHYDFGVYEDVIKSDPTTWCRAFYKIGSCVEDVENNSTESFNATILKAREKPLVPMLDIIARIAMERICKRYIIVVAHLGVCTPYVQDLLALELPATSQCAVFRSTNMMFSVSMGGQSYRVSLETRSCSCRKWDIRGVPCEHAYAVIINRKLEVEDFVSHWFRTTMWRRTYQEGLTPTRGSRFWPQGTGPTVHPPPPPAQPGRKKKEKKQKRKKGVNESPTKKKPMHLKRVMHCGICGSSGHNCRGHKKLSLRQSQEEPSQSQP